VGSKAFTHKTGIGVEQCPKCQNRQSFVGHSLQVSEDCCEVWVACECGYTPGSEFRMEDVWGSLDAETISAALANCWNEPLRRVHSAGEKS
jgi:hypothetical protein